MAIGGEGYHVFYATDTGVALAATARLIKTSVNEDLTATGVSEMSFPNTGWITSLRLHYRSGKQGQMERLDWLQLGYQQEIVLERRIQWFHRFP